MERIRSGTQRAIRVWSELEALMGRNISKVPDRPVLLRFERVGFAPYKTQRSAVQNVTVVWCQAEPIAPPQTPVSTMSKRTP